MDNNIHAWCILFYIILGIPELTIIAVVSKGVIFNRFPPWEDVLSWNYKFWIFFYIERMWWSSKDSFLSVFTLEGCSGLERTDFGWFSLEGGGGLDWFWITAYIHYFLSVCLYVCLHVSLDCYTGQNFWLNDQWQTQLMQLGHIIIIVSVGTIVFCVQYMLLIWLMPLSSYVAFILAYFPQWWTLSNSGMWHFRGLFFAGAYMAITW